MEFDQMGSCRLTSSDKAESAAADKKKGSMNKTKHLTTAEAAASIRKIWGFRTASRIHGDGKQSRGYNRRREDRSWKGME
jgi:hypothetical protein